MIKTVSVTRLPKVPLVRRASLIIDIWNLFVICFLLFGALIQNLFDFMDRHYLVTISSSFI
jgi:hypothetical protein